MSYYAQIKAGTIQQVIVATQPYVNWVLNTKTWI